MTSPEQPLQISSQMSSYSDPARANLVEEQELTLRGKRGIWRAFGRWRWRRKVPMDRLVSADLARAGAPPGEL